MASNNQIVVLDLFAGPGGLGEGFSAFSTSEGNHPFRVGLSIEKETNAHRTLQLRSFFRQFSRGGVPEEYYAHLRDQTETPLQKLFEYYPDQAERASREAWQTELGKTPNEEIDERIAEAIPIDLPWILTGGPPCQAYSIVGRSRVGGIKSNDHRVHLYKEYLRILAEHSPAVFVMENVRGILSAKLDNQPIFPDILRDLQLPGKAVGMKKTNKKYNPEYEIFSLVCPPAETFFENGITYQPKDFLIKCEEHGIPQARHRVIILGVLKDWNASPELLGKCEELVYAERVLDDLPRIRSGLSRQADSKEAWAAEIKKILSVTDYPLDGIDSDVAELMRKTARDLRLPHADTGSEFRQWRKDQVRVGYRIDWYWDERLQGVCNHKARNHIASDLLRYLFVICFGHEKGRSPKMKDFPKELHPNHRNLDYAIYSGHFEDRFRVQLKGRPSTTVTSHLAKDGHYFIHYDPGQCRSMTVREAARLQTFPDNYFFCGPRTAQYQQVGNAVPPLLAVQIAELVYNLFQAH